MAVGFILGRSGTGKTSYCVKSIVEALLDQRNERPLIFLVPEQATYQAERAILSDGRVGGYSRLHVLSFERLGFLLRGRYEVLPRIGELGRKMVIQKILRAKAGELKLFGPCAQRAGLSHQIGKVIEELQRYDKKYEDLAELAGELKKEDANRLTAMKFEEIGLIYNDYLKFFEGRFVNPDTQLSEARRVIAEAGFIKGAKLWVDGFAGFTGQELLMLVELLKAVSEARIALCIDAARTDLNNSDAGKLDPMSLFSPTERTYAELLGIIKKSKLPLLEPIVLKSGLRFEGAAELAHIERSLFEAKAGVKLRQGEAVRVVSAPNVRAEVQFVAREILDLVRKKRYRFSDIAVVASDIGAYEHYIRASFNDCKIPFFLDTRRSLVHHPLIELVTSALRAVVGNFSNSDIFAWLKTDLVPPARRDVDVLENYCLAFGIRREDWKREEEWLFDGGDENYFDELRIDELRRKAVRPLSELEEELGGGKITAEKFTGAVFEFLERLQVREKLGEWIEQAIADGDFEKADEHRQCYEGFVKVSEELVTVFGNEVMGAGEYLSIIEAAFSEMSLAMIPPKLDEVLLGTIERSRHPDLRAVFLIGALQKKFPVPVQFPTVLSDEDRCAAERKEFYLADTMEQQLAGRQYLAYIAFTRARERLYVTYPLADAEGNAVGPSEFVAEMESLFKDFSEEFYNQEQCDIAQVRNETELADLLCERSGKDAGEKRDGCGGEEPGGLLRLMCFDEELGKIGESVTKAVEYDNHAELGEGFTEWYFGWNLNVSVTELGSFAACPYKYFARYILGLEKRKLFGLEPLDLGNFYHRILERLFRRLRESNKDFANITNEELMGLLGAVITAECQSNPRVSNFIRRRKHNKFIVESAAEILEECVPVLAEMARAGAFRQVGAEVNFGREGSEVSELRLALSRGRTVYVRGKIDRIDVADIDGRNIAVVFDYKRGQGSASFSWPEFYNGLDMQLPVYLLAIKGQKIEGVEDIEAGGGFYVPIEVRAKKAGLDELEGENSKSLRKAKGIFNGKIFEQLDSVPVSKWSRFYNFGIGQKEGQYGWYGTSGALKPGDFERVLKFTEEKIVELAGRILGGEIDVKPYRLQEKSPCRNCEYRPVCRFDWQINDYNLMESRGKKEVLEEREGGR